LSWRLICGLFIMNIGMLSMSKSLMTVQNQSQGNKNPSPAKFVMNSLDLQALSYLRLAQKLSNLPTTRWALGRVALANGDSNLAAEILQPIATKCTTNPLLYQDTVLSLSLVRSGYQAISFYETCSPPEVTPMISDTVAFSYLQKAQLSINMNELVAAGSTLRQVIALRPSDLYANYYLWQTATQAGKENDAIALRQKLTNFPIEAINPADSRLVDFSCEVIPFLLKDKIWDQATGLRVISALLVTHSDLDSVKGLVETLASMYPDQSELLFDLGELHQRRGEYAQAEAAYRHYQVDNPQEAEVYLRLGMICEAQSDTCNLQQRISLYEQYNRMKPNDLLGLRYYSKALAAEGSSQADTVIQDLEELSDDRRLVETLTRLPFETIQLGENVMGNGGFEGGWRNVAPSGWFSIDHATGDKYWNLGTFLSAPDTLGPYQGQYSASITGFWEEYDTHRSPAQFGFWQQEENSSNIGWTIIPAGRAYLVSLAYQTNDMEENLNPARLQLALSPDPLWYPIPLPTTSGEWRRFGVVVCAPGDKPQSITVLLSSLTLGQVHFDDISLREIKAPVNRGCYRGESGEIN
jgi:tetratricopeptide (TPR) repeat protein